MNRKLLNIIWIILDGVRNYHCPNDPENMGKPPIIDELAEEGVEFNCTVSSATSTQMSTASMLASMNSSFLSLNYNHFTLSKKNFPFLPIILEELGYSIYDINISYEFRRKTWTEVFKHVDKKYYPDGLKSMQMWNNDPFTEILNNLLDDGIGLPFFLFMHFNGRRDAGLSDKVRFCINLLKEKNLYDESIFVITSDHGMPDSERQNFYGSLKEKGINFNRHDLILTDDNILVPLVIKYPGCDAGKKINECIGLIDVTPTILDIIGLPQEKKAIYERDMHGVSLLPLIAGENEVFYKNRVIRTDTRFFAQSDKITSIRDNDFKYIIYHDKEAGENELFFDIVNDPFEQKNLTSSENKYIQGKLEKYRKNFITQEKELFEYLYRFLKDKFFEEINPMIVEKNSSQEVKILLFGTCHPAFAELLKRIIDDYFKDPVIDFLLERANSFDRKELSKLGFRNNHIVGKTGDWMTYQEMTNKGYREQGLLYYLEEYDYIIIPITDYRADIEQRDAKSTSGKMKVDSPSHAIGKTVSFNPRLLKDYKTVFKVVKKIKSGKVIFLDYNMHLFTRPKWFLIKSYLIKTAANWDVYLQSPIEFFREVRRFISKVWG